MNVQETKEQLIAELIRLAFAEDIGDGDHTTLCCIPATEMGKSQLIVKERLSRLMRQDHQAQRLLSLLMNY